MAKKIISDIIVSKKSIRQIPLSKEKDHEYKDLKKEIINLEENNERYKKYTVNHNH